jgi:hypothetical protein
MTNEKITKDTELIINEDELTEEQKQSVNNLENFFNFKLKSALEAILNALSSRFQQKQSKIKKRKNGSATRYEQGWLDATEEFFNGVAGFLSTLEAVEKNQEVIEEESIDDSRR